MVGERAQQRYRTFLIESDVPPLLDSTYLVQGEAFIVYIARESFTFGYDVPSREVPRKRSGEEGKAKVSLIVTSTSPTGLAVQMADALTASKSGIILTDRRIAAFHVVPKDPSLKEPSLVDGIKDFGRFLARKEELPPYPMTCRTILEHPAAMVSYQGVHREKPKNCVKANYHRIAFNDGSVIGLLA